jgi:hypothetical protein
MALGQEHELRRRRLALQQVGARADEPSIH